MQTLPTNNSRLRPRRSVQRTATRVGSIPITPLPTWAAIEALLPMPSWVSVVGA